MWVIKTGVEVDKIKSGKAINWIVTNKFKLAVVIVLVIGCLVRLINLDGLPDGLDCDEASSGYEAYAIGEYGVDRNGKEMPVFLVSWGSGQNALYTYLLIPFVKIFGLNTFSVRLPMDLIGCLSLFIFYKLVLLLKNKKAALIALIFFSICPWHIMKSRWGLESNIFPDLVLLAVYLSAYGIKNKKNIFTYLGFAVLGLSSYAYGTSYFFLPFFVIPALIYLTVKKEMKLKTAIISFLIMSVITIPIVLCVIINKFDLPEFKFLWFTIPRMASNRFEQLSSVFSSNFISSSFSNFGESIKILITQYDGLGWSAIQYVGTTYLFSLPFTIIGIIKSFIRNKKSPEYEDNRKLKNIINIWFIVSVVLLFICEPNINRINIIFIPIIYYTVVGIYEMMNVNNKKFKIIISTVIALAYASAFVAFGYLYTNTKFSDYFVFEDNLKEVIEYVDSKDDKNIYIDNTIKEGYIYSLFYTKENPNEFYKTVQFFKGNKMDFGNVRSYGNKHFYLPGDANDVGDKSVLVIDKRNNYEYDKSKFKVKEFERFIVLENK
jgi:hypothetical protein